MENNGEHLMTLSGLCDFLDISYNQAQRFKNDTDLPRVKIGKKHYYLASSVLKWIHRKEQEARNGTS